MKYSNLLFSLLSTTGSICFATSLRQRSVSSLSSSLSSARTMYPTSQNRLLLSPAVSSRQRTFSTTTTSTGMTSTSMNGESELPLSLSKESGRLFKEDINILYDSKCNVCQLEISFLRKLDVRLHGEDSPKLRFTDLEGSEYDGTDPINGMVDYAKGMKAMHGVLPNGQVLEGVPVFVEAYRAVNLGWLFGIYRVAPLRWLLDRGYDVFAKYRTNITRGTSVSALVESYREKRELLEAQNDQLQGSCETCATKVPK